MDLSPKGSVSHINNANEGASMLTQICAILYNIFLKEGKRLENDMNKIGEKSWNILLDTIGGGNAEYDYRRNLDLKWSCEWPTSKIDPKLFVSR